ncbi:MAG: SH3 domain-containing protein [Bdellovibrionales bacterium]
MNRLGLFLLALCFVVDPARALCVSAYQTRLRAEPNAGAKITWVVGRYMPLAEIERRGGWYKVRDMDGDVHWALVSELSGRERCVVVKVRSAELRTGPGVKQPLADVQTVDRYTAFKRLEADPENWYRVEDEVGNRYWIAATQVWRATTVSRIGF